MFRRSDVPQWFVLLLFAVAWYLWALARRLLERRRQSWPVVRGRIATTYVQAEMDDRERRTPEVCYSYSVNGKHYYGVLEVFEGDFDAYPPGSPILVHYKPSDPSVSRLDVRQMRDREHALDVVDAGQLNQDD